MAAAVMSPVPATPAGPVMPPSFSEKVAEWIIHEDELVSYTINVSGTPWKRRVVLSTLNPDLFFSLMLSLSQPRGCTIINSAFLLSNT